jgi:hypothetical protein
MSYACIPELSRCRIAWVQKLFFVCRVLHIETNRGLGMYDRLPLPIAQLIELGRYSRQSLNRLHCPGSFT